MIKILTNGVVSSLILIIFGIVLMMYPTNTLLMLCRITGWGLIISGVVGLATLVLRKREDETESGSSGAAFIVKVVLSLVIGIFCLIRSETVVSILPSIAAVLLIINGAVNTIQAISASKRERGWIVPFLFGICCVIVGTLILLNPFSEAIAFAFLLGLSMVIDGVSNLLSGLILKA